MDNFPVLLERFYTEQGRHDMAWRQPEADGSFNPYKILVSEIMLPPGNSSLTLSPDGRVSKDVTVLQPLIELLLESKKTHFFLVAHLPSCVT